MKVHSLEGIFYEFKESFKSERFLRVEEFYSEKILNISISNPQHIVSLKLFSSRCSQ